MRLGKVVAIVGLVTIAAAGSATGATKVQTNPPVITSLLECRRLTDDSARLACFDKAASAVDTATASGDLVSIDREQRRAARRQAFGFALPSLSFLERGDKPEEVDRLTGIVADADLDGFGKWVVRLEDGAVWTQIEVDPLARRPRKGSSVVISTGMLGGYFMTIDGQGAGKAKRVS